MLTISKLGPAPLNLSLPDFNKGHRCPGWSGEGWRSNAVNWCNDELAPGQSRWALTVTGRQSRRAASHATELPGFYSWRVRRTNCCNTVVLPQALMYLAPQSWVMRQEKYDPETREYREGWGTGPAIWHLNTWFELLPYRVSRRLRRKTS